MLIRTKGDIAMYKLERTLDGMTTTLSKTSSSHTFLFDSYDTAQVFAHKLNSHLKSYAPRWEVKPLH